MSWGLLPTKLQNFIDSIFAPPLSFLTMMRDMLNNTSSVIGRGINLNNYFSFFGYLPTEWQAVIQSALASITLLAILWMVKAIWNTYLNTKGSLKWW